MPSNAKGRGVLPVSAAQTKKPFKQHQPRPPAPRLRLIIRRLAPGLTEDEFWDSVGAEWQVGKGKVDWAAFKPGKISKDLAKPSRPARAYLKVKDTALLDQLSAHVKAIRFQDAKNTAGDSCLIGPPTLEFAPYNKVPSARLRHDGRQGTIDQDPEFISFLQSLTEPIAKSSANGDASEAKLDKAAITPLVQYIKDKKASKAKEKEAAAAKKGQEGKEKGSKDAKDGKEGKEKTPSSNKGDKTTIVRATATNEAEKVRVAKATQQAMDSIKKSVAEIKGQGPSKQDQKASEKKDQTASQATPKRERQRGDASAAARIIGRDLGLIPKDGRAPRGQRAVTQPAPSPAAQTSTSSAPNSKPAPPVPAAPVKAQSPSVPPPTAPRGPRNAPPQQVPAKAAAAPLPKTKPNPQPSPGAKSAFLKHANPSQGVTEELLRTTFATFGEMTRCEIDRKKGLGYVDFVDAEGLKKAMAASPIKIGNGQVIVLENRTPYKKVSQASSRSNQASPVPNASTPSSPKVAQANLATIAEQSQPHFVTVPQPSNDVPTMTPQNAVTSPAIETTTTKVQSDVADINDAAAGTQAQPATSASTQTQPGTPTMPRGGRGNARGAFRGRAGRGGRGGHFKGGNRAVSTPNPNANSNAPANAPPGPAAG